MCVYLCVYVCIYVRSCVSMYAYACAVVFNDGSNSDHSKIFRLSEIRFDH